MSKPVELSGAAVLARLRQRGLELDAGFLRGTLQTLAQMLIELEVSAAIEADPYERNDKRRAYRNGYRRRNWRSRLGDIPLNIPKLRQGTYYPQLIETLPQAEPLLLAAVLDAFVYGAEMGRMDEVLDRLGLAGTQPDQIADMVARLDDRIEAFRQRPLTAGYPALRLDVLPLQTRSDSRAIHFDVVVAAGERRAGQRDIVGFEVMPRAEGREFWGDFLGGLVERGLSGVEVVTADAQRDGLRQAARELFHTATFRWQTTEAAYHLPEARLTTTAPVIAVLDAEVVMLPLSLLAVKRLVGLALLQMGRAESDVDEVAVAA